MKNYFLILKINGKMLREVACYKCILCEPATKLLLFVSFVYLC